MHNHHKIVFIFLLLVGFLSFAFASAKTDASSPDNAVLIKQLQEMIKSLQAQIKNLQTQIDSSKKEIETVKTEIKE